MQINFLITTAEPLPPNQNVIPIFSTILQKKAS
jgi:hypothetical protein